MTSTYRITLDKSSKKYPCPKCGKKRFVKYVDSQSGEYIHDAVGRCDRENSCSYHLKPKEYFVQNPGHRISDAYSHQLLGTKADIKTIDFISENVVAQSMRHFETNHFVIWLRSLFNYEYVNKIIQHYKIGSSKYWKGSTAFWQIDQHQNVRQAKIILYDATNGKRNRNKGVFFAGKKIMKMQGKTEPRLVQCFFGEHLITSDHNNIIGILESEKSAILMTIFSWIGIAPKYTYIATGGKNGCRWYETSVHEYLETKRVVVFPDLGVYKDWNEKSKFLKADKVIVSDILERIATEEEKSEGYDIADYYLKLWNDRRSEQNKQAPPHVKSSGELILEYLGNINPLIYTMMEELNLEIA